MTMNLQMVSPYGDSPADGAMQLSFTLPVPHGAEAKEAAKELVERLGFQAVSVVHTAPMGSGFTFFVVYAKCPLHIDFTAIHVPQVAAEPLDFEAANQFIRAHIGRRLVVIGACTGDDAHTVGLDAIMNMKGYAGNPGLERYPMLSVHNLGSQVKNEELLAKARELKADVVLVSQVVTQKNVHVHNLTELIEMAEAEGLRSNILFICGGPRLSHELALELGFDAGFGPGTLPPQVAAYIAQEMAKRLE